jgi:tetratricopeptide (TPR) repeat protein
VEWIVSFEKRKAIQNATTLTQQGWYDKAIAEYEAILSADPSDHSLYNTLGDLHVRIGSMPEAIAYYQKLFAVLRSEGLFHRAIAVCKKIIKLDPNNISELAACADLYAEEGFRAEAKHQYLLAAERSLKLGFDEQALDAYERLIRLEPGDTGRAAKLASLLEREGRRSEAANLLGRLAEEVRMRGQLDEARLLYRQMVEIAPQIFTGWYCLGRIEFELGQFQEAKEALRRAAKVDADSPLPHLLLGQLYEQQMQPDHAKAAWRALLRCEPNHQEAHHRLGLLYLNEGDTEAAVREFDAAARSLSHSGELERAIALLGGLGAAAEHPLIQERLGELLERSGRPAEAEAAFRCAAQVRLASGSVEEGQRMLTQLPALEPEDHDAVAGSPTGPITENRFMSFEPEERHSSAPSTPTGRSFASEAPTSPEQAGEPAEEILQILEEADQEDRTVLRTRDESAEGSPAPLGTIEHYLDQGMEAEARALLRRLVASEPGNVEAARRLSLLESEALTDGAAGPPETTGVQSDDIHPIDRSPETCEAHYRLGVAYREMGLLDDAIAEFRRSAADDRLTLPACNMVGLCLLAKGVTEAAIHELGRGLSMVGRPVEEYHGIKYDLATAYQSIGDLTTAVAILRDLRTENPSFRDVKSRVRELEGRLADGTDLSAATEGNGDAARQTQSG